MSFQPGDTPIFTDRETAREYRLKEIARPDPIFSTYEPEWIRDFHRQGLKWIDCAPEGANHLLAPLQGKDGRPCNSWANNENVGPNKALRAAREARGLNPFSGDLEFPKVGDRRKDAKGYDRIWVGDRWELEANGQALKREDFPGIYDAIAHYTDDHNALD